MLLTKSLRQGFGTRQNPCVKSALPMGFHRQDRNISGKVSTYSPRERLCPREAYGELFISCFPASKHQAILSSQCLQYFTHGTNWISKCKNQIQISEVFAHSGQSKPGQLAKVSSVTNTSPIQSARHSHQLLMYQKTTKQYRQPTRIIDMFLPQLLS